MQVLHAGPEVVFHQDNLRPCMGDDLHCLISGGDARPVVVGSEPDFVRVMFLEEVAELIHVGGAIEGTERYLLVFEDDLAGEGIEDALGAEWRNGARIPAGD